METSHTTLFYRTLDLSLSLSLQKWLIGCSSLLVCLLFTSLFVFHKHFDIINLLLYVDDIIITSNNSSLLDNFICKLNSEFATKDLGPLNYFLGLEATTTFDSLFISQLKYARDILTWAQLLNNKPVHTPWLFHNTCLLMVLCCRILHFIDLLLVLSSIWPSPVWIFLMLSTMLVNFSTPQLNTTFLLSNTFFAMLKACYTLASPFIPLLLLVLYRLPWYPPLYLWLLYLFWW